MTRAQAPLLVALASLLIAPPLADAEEPLRGTYIPIPDDQVTDPIPAGGVNGATLYLNRCVGGCTVNAGFENSSITDTSSIAGSTRFLSEFAHGDEAWDQFVGCVTGIFEPFDIAVTDIDPGTAPHHEVMVAGTDAEFGMDGALGVSPGTCTPINNSLTFVFANLSSDVFNLCWAAAQEPGHSWTMDHQLLCEDPMTYLTEPCGVAKYGFQDAEAQCHTQDIQPKTQCTCGGATQNSFQTVMALFGPNPNASGPAIEIVRPADGATVGPGFPIEASVSDISKLEPVELYIDGQLISALDFGPFVYNAPVEMTSGTVSVEIRSSDVHGFQSSETIEVTIDPEAGTGGPGGEEEGGGCSAGGSGGAPLLMLLALGLYAWRRRNSSSTSDT